MSDDLDPIPPEAAFDYYVDARQYDLADETMASHKYRLDSFVRWLVSEDHGESEIVNMNDVDLRDIHAYRVFKRDENWEGQDPCSSVTLQGQVSTIRKFLEYLVGINAVPSDLHEKIMLPTVQDGEGVDETILEPDLAHNILEHLQNWEYGTPEHIAFLLFWRTSCRLGDLRAVDVRDIDFEEGAICFRHRPGTDTPLKNQKSGERDASLKPEVIEQIEDYLDSPHRHEVTDDHGRTPLLTTAQGRPATSTLRNWTYRLTQPCRLGMECPEGRDPDECDATYYANLSECPVALSPHPIRAGSITAHRNAGTPREVVSDRGDVSEKILEKHYDQASERERMRRRREFIPDNL